MKKPRLFTLIRKSDETGVSGTGRILDGTVHHNGKVVICWRSDVNSQTPGFSSTCIYPSWKAFSHVHIAPHDEAAVEVVFGTEGDLEEALANRKRAGRNE